MLVSVPDGRGGAAAAAGERDQPAGDVAEFGRDADRDQGADRQILQEALLELGEIDVEHHHDEQEQHGDRADIDDDEDHREEFGAHQQEQARGIDEGQDEEQHGMNGIAGEDHAERRRHEGQRENPEEERVAGHVILLGSPLSRSREKAAGRVRPNGSHPVAQAFAPTLSRARERAVHL